MSIKSVPNARLTYMARYIESAVPIYDVRQSDPLIAAQTGTGNFVAKAVIAGVLLERNNWAGGTLPALAWNRNTHPQKYEDLLGRVSLRNGHALLLATNNDAERIDYVAFNPMGTAADAWEIDDFNSLDEDAVVRDGLIVPTPRGVAAQYVIREWHEGGSLYMDALGVHDSAFHVYDREKMTDIVISNLVSRDLLTDFSV